MATAERIERGYVGTLLRLTLLAPEFVEAILDGRLAAGPGLSTLLEPFPPGWALQNGIIADRLGAGRMP